MKKIIVSTLALALFAGMGLTKTAYPQNQNGSSKKSVTHKIGLIDMAEVFKEYKKFATLRESLKAEIQDSDRKAKTLAAQAQSLQKELQSGNFAEGSPDYKKREDKILQLKSEFEVFRNKAQREFLRRESRIYKTVYLDVAQAVQKYAEYYDYTLILRFNRQALEEAENPQQVLQSMNRQVVYFRSEDDITDSVIRYLNSTYDQSQRDGGTATRTSGGSTK